MDARERALDFYERRLEKLATEAARCMVGILRLTGEHKWNQFTALLKRELEKQA